MQLKLMSNVKELATQRGLTAHALAAAAGVTPPTVYGVWTGNVSTKRAGTLALVARALNVFPHELYTIQDKAASQ